VQVTAQAHASACVLKLHPSFEAQSASSMQVSIAVWQ
jgi:hypothetical protein